MWKVLQRWQEKHLWVTSSTIGFLNIMASYISFERISCILVVNSSFLWILLIIFKGTIVIVENYALFGNYYFCLYSCAYLGLSLVILGNSCSFLFEWGLYIIFGVSCTFWVGFPIFKGGS